MQETRDDLNKVNELMLLNEAELVVLIGKDILGVSFGAIEESEHDKRVSGESWFERNSLSLRNTICKSDNVRNNFSRGGDYLKLAVLDIVAGVVTGVSPLVVTALILKKGLSNYCDKVWNDD